MTDQEKYPYIQMAQSDSERYRSELSQRKPNSSKQVKKTYSKDLLSRIIVKSWLQLETKGIVVAPRLPYMYYILINTPAYKVTHRDSTRDKIRKDLAEEWKTLGDEEKKIYLQKGEEDQVCMRKRWMLLNGGRRKSSS